MKLIARQQDRNLNRRRGEPAYYPWTQWEVCEGTEGLTEAELSTFVREWVMPELGDRFDLDKPGHWLVSGAYGKEEFRIVDDAADPADY